MRLAIPFRLQTEVTFSQRSGGICASWSLSERVMRPNREGHRSPPRSSKIKECVEAHCYSLYVFVQLHLIWRTDSLILYLHKNLRQFVTFHVRHEMVQKPVTIFRIYGLTCTLDTQHNYKESDLMVTPKETSAEKQYSPWNQRLFASYKTFTAAFTKTRHWTQFWPSWIHSTPPQTSSVTANVGHVGLYEGAVHPMRKKLKWRFDGGDPDNRKWQRGCDGAYRGVWRVSSHADSFVSLHLARMRLQSPWRCFHIEFTHRPDNQGTKDLRNVCQFLP